MAKVTMKIYGDVSRHYEKRKQKRNEALPLPLSLSIPYRSPFYLFTPLLHTFLVSIAATFTLFHFNCFAFSTVII